MFEMQREPSIIKSASALINDKLQQLLDDDFSFKPAHINLLNQQPTNQRLSFLKKAIEDKLNVFLQLMPINNDGYPVNVRGIIKAIGNKRYLVKIHNVNYIVNVDQIRYIANI